MRYSYPSYQEVIKDGGIKQRERVEINEPPGRPFLILRKKFVTDAETAEVDISPENLQLKETVSNTVAPSTAPADGRNPDELPF